MAPPEVGQIVFSQSSQPQAQCNTAVPDHAFTLPAGFPNVLSSPMSWIGKQHSDETSYVVMLSLEDLAELNRALLHFKCKFLDLAMRKKKASMLTEMIFQLLVWMVIWWTRPISLYLSLPRS